MSSGLFLAHFLRIISTLQPPVVFVISPPSPPAWYRSRGGQPRSLLFPHLLKQSLGLAGLLSASCLFSPEPAYEMAFSTLRSQHLSSQRECLRSHRWDSLHGCSLNRSPGASFQKVQMKALPVRELLGDPQVLIPIEEMPGLGCGVVADCSLSQHRALASISSKRDSGNK